MKITYQIVHRGDFVSWHLSFQKALERVKEIDDASEVRIYEVPEDGEMPIDTYPCCWSGDNELAVDLDPRDVWPN